MPAAIAILALSGGLVLASAAIIAGTSPLVLLTLGASFAAGIGLIFVGGDDD